MAAPRISDSDKAYLLSIKPEDIDNRLLCNLFGDKYVNKNGKKEIEKSRFKPYMEFDLKKGEYINKTDITTTVGSLIFNKFIVEYCKVESILGYVNEVLRESVVGSLSGKMTEALRTDKVSYETFVNYMDRLEWLGMRPHSLFCASFTPGTLKPIPEVIKLRDKLMEEHKEALSKGDAITMAKIEKELLTLAKEKLKNDPGLALYDSEARGSFGNNYKSICITKGAVFNPVEGKNDMVTSCFMEGIAKNDLPAMGNTVPGGAYPKAIGTGTSGYFSKQILAALQTVVIDESLQDCGSKGSISVTIPKKNTGDYLYRYVEYNGKRVYIDDNNIKQFIGKEVKMFTPMACTSKKLCLSCVGKMFTELGITNVGLTAAKVSSTLLNLSLKSFHDATTKLSVVDIKNITI